MQLYKVVAGVLKIDTGILDESSNALNTENWDSLRHIELMLAVEMAFGVQFSMAEMVSMQNLGDMRHLLVSKGISFDEAEPMLKSA